MLLIILGVQVYHLKPLENVWKEEHLEFTSIFSNARFTQDAMWSEFKFWFVWPWWTGKVISALTCFTNPITTDYIYMWIHKLDGCCLIVRRFINDIWACVGRKYHTFRVCETDCFIETGNWTCAVVPFNCGLRWLYATEWILYPPNIYEFWINSCGMFYWALQGTLDFVYVSQVYMWTSSNSRHVLWNIGMFFDFGVIHIN